MKKLLVLFLAVVMVFALVACASEGTESTPETSSAAEQQEVKDDPAVKGEGVMKYDEFVAAATDADVVIEGYVQAKQSWWQDKACLYLADKDGAYFVYNAACTQDDYNKLTQGTKIKVTGKKAEWKGEIEVGEGATFVIENGNYIAEAFDATALLGNDEELIKHQNHLVAFKGLTVAGKKDKDGKEYAFFYGYSNEGEEGSDSDLYFDATIGDKTYTFTVEYYLCNEESDAYQAVQNLKVGDQIDIEGFLYWYDTQSTQVTALTVK